MSSIVISGDSSGAITLAAPSVAGTNTATLPAAAGTVMVSGNMPVFSYYADGSQTLSSGTGTKLLFATKEFDTNNFVSSSRFTPTIAGYYQINAQLQPNTSYTGGWIAIWKNGSVFKNGNYCTAISFGGFVVSAIVYFNGSTDYVEIYGDLTVGQNAGAGPNFTYFQGAMVRTA